MWGGGGVYKGKRCSFGFGCGFGRLVDLNKIGRLFGSRGVLMVRPVKEPSHLVDGSVGSCVAGIERL